jgi:hypothetical protein
VLSQRWLAMDVCSASDIPDLGSTQQHIYYIYFEFIILISSKSKKQIVRPFMGIVRVSE